MAGVVKICGVTRAADAVAAAACGATHIGFVFHAKSPRAIDAAAASDIVLSLKQAAFDQAFALPDFVGLFVDAGERPIAEAAPFLTHLQLHGRESPARCAALRDRFGLEVIKALPVASASDCEAASDWDGSADMLVFDARPPEGAERSGGHGRTFDWSLLGSYRGAAPFLLAGGLTAANVAAAVAAARASPGFAGVDVSSGVESAPGVKNKTSIEAFVSAAKSALA